MADNSNEMTEALGEAAHTLEQSLKLAAAQQQQLDTLQGDLDAANAELDATKTAAADFTASLEAGCTIAGVTVADALGDGTPSSIVKLATTIIEAATDAPDGGAGVAKTANSEESGGDPDGWSHVIEEGA